MTLRTDIAAITADPANWEPVTGDDGAAGRQLTATAFRDISTIKVDAIVSRLAGMLNQRWIVNGVDYTLLSVARGSVNGIPSVQMTLRRAGTGFDVTDQLIITNPPIADGAGNDIDAMSAAQLAAFGRQVIGTLPLPRAAA